MIKPLFNNLNINTKRHSFLIGDSAYNTKNKRFVKYNNNKVTNIQLIFPYKKNQKDKNKTFHKKLLSKRYIVEHVFSLLKRSFKRIN